MSRLFKSPFSHQTIAYTHTTMLFQNWSIASMFNPCNFDQTLGVSVCPVYAENLQSGQACPVSVVVRHVKLVSIKATFMLTFINIRKDMSKANGNEITKEMKIETNISTETK